MAASPLNPDEMTPLGRRIHARKDERGLSIVQIAKHHVTYRQMVMQNKGEPRTWRRAFSALGWDPDSVPAALGGGEPRELVDRPAEAPPQPPTPEGDPATAFEVGGAVAAGWPEMTDNERRAINDVVDALHRRKSKTTDSQSGARSTT